MYAFYQYYPMQFKKVSQSDWQVRKLIWDFKDGRAYKAVAEITANAMIKCFGSEVKNIVLRAFRHHPQRRTKSATRSLPPWYADSPVPSMPMTTSE